MLCSICQDILASKLERALRIPALSKGWQASFQAILKQESSAESRRKGIPGSRMKSSAGMARIQTDASRADP